jgi:hypothetical protein
MLWRRKDKQPRRTLRDNVVEEGIEQVAQRAMEPAHSEVGLVKIVNSARLSRAFLVRIAA